MNRTPTQGREPRRDSAPPRHLPLLVSMALLCIGLVVSVRSVVWHGAPFPGFFLMPNRVVPSAGLPTWSGVAEGRPPYQEVLLAVDGMPVTSGADGYRRAAAHHPGEPVQYLFARREGTETRTYPLRVFSDTEHAAIFGAYVISGAAYLLLAILAGANWRRDPLYRGLTAFAWASAAFAFTAVDLYGPGTMFRLHVLAEACLPAAATHLALVCPRNRLARRPTVLPLVYGLALAFAAVYEMFLDQPSAYTVIHNFAQGLVGLPVVVFTVLLGLAADDPSATLGRPAALTMLGAALAGIVMPGLVLGLSGLTGGSLPVNVSAWSGFLFPLGAVVALRLAAVRSGVGSSLQPA